MNHQHDYTLIDHRDISVCFFSSVGEYSSVVLNAPGIRLKIVGRGYDDFNRSPVIRLSNGTLLRCPDPCGNLKYSEPYCISKCFHDLGVLEGLDPARKTVSDSEESLNRTEQTAVSNLKKPVEWISERYSFPAMKVTP